MRTFYEWLPVLAIVLPPAGAVWYVLRRGRSARVAAWFVVPYWTLLIAVVLWLFGFKGFQLLGAIVLVAGVGALGFFSNAIAIDALVQWVRSFRRL